MGVQGLWALLEPAGKPIPLETLENKILAIGNDTNEKSCSTAQNWHSFSSWGRYQLVAKFTFVFGIWSIKHMPLLCLILSTDVSIWLHQALKGFRDKEGGAVANAHLLGLFHRICKLLFYRIRPIFVFDGPAPQLKRDTLRRRQHAHLNAIKKSRVAGAKVLDNFVRRQVVAAQLQRQTLAVEKVLEHGQEGLVELIQKRVGKGRGGLDEKDLFELPPLPGEDPEANFISNL